jgi:hypothetical protein
MSALQNMMGGMGGGMGGGMPGKSKDSMLQVTS